MNAIRRIAAVAGLAIASHAAAQVTFYERQGFQGRSFTTERQVPNFERHGVNDQFSSAVVVRNRWEVCEDARFSGRCVVLRPGQYPSLAAMGMNDRISSVRLIGKKARVNTARYAPAPLVSHDYRRRKAERLYEANVTSVRAVVGPPEQRCWVEREHVVQTRSDNNVPGALAGAVIGGILGHQIGGGRGQDIATAGGAIAGAVVGNNIGRGSPGQTVSTQDVRVRHCERTPHQAQPDYWDVSYTFRGAKHRMQMTHPPARRSPSMAVASHGRRIMQRQKKESGPTWPLFCCSPCMCPARSSVSRRSRWA